MKTEILNAPGDLFLGSDIATAQAQGPRRFRSAAKAVRFAMEHAAPVSLHGAMLRIGGVDLGPAEIRSLHRELTAAAHPATPRGGRRIGRSHGHERQ
ncbi:hypothetical protein ACFOOL_12420 [Devosia honganensis]|uniref:Uncharacterized protein n=1 Tax=Devosia honganensis TaxID=1610527 RepID=A0ABV7X2J5_9HYPH